MSQSAAAAPPSILGSLAAQPNVHLTTHIGTEFPSPNTQLSALLSAPNSDELLRDLATLVSHRGVVFFRAQDITNAQQKELALRMGQLTGRPATSSLHRHPVSEDIPELGTDTSVISSQMGIARAGFRKNTRASTGWHSDITFEPVPSDYAILKMHTLPALGGDTLWASGYEAYDRLSPAFARFLEGLSAEHDGNFFHAVAQREGHAIITERGAPENTGTDLRAVHPVIRTHPVTGYKTLFANQSFTRRILELAPDESDDVLAYLARHIAENHDLQVRFRWERDSVAIWDNRATFHTATNDYGTELRQGNRVVGLGERPYFDPKSTSRRAALGIDL